MAIKSLDQRASMGAYSDLDAFTVCESGDEDVAIGEISFRGPITSYLPHTSSQARFTTHFQHLNSEPEGVPSDWTTLNSSRFKLRSPLKIRYVTFTMTVDLIWWFTKKKQKSLIDHLITDGYIFLIRFMYDLFFLKKKHTKTKKEVHSKISIFSCCFKVRFFFGLFIFIKKSCDSLIHQVNYM